MSATMSSMLALLLFMVMVAPAAAVLYGRATQCSSIAPYTGYRTPSGRNFQPSWRECAEAIKRVRNRTPRWDDDIDDCTAHVITYQGAVLGNSEEYKYLVRCPASPDAVWVSYDGIKYGMYYVLHRDDTGCDTISDVAVAAASYVVLNQ